MVGGEEVKYLKVIFPKDVADFPEFKELVSSYRAGEFDVLEVYRIHGGWWSAALEVGGRTLAFQPLGVLYEKL